MKTTKPLSTISYNSFAFLQGTLDKLLDAKFIDFYAFIEHEPEEDENKKHWHVYVEPCQQIDVTWLKAQFAELDISHPTQPLGTMKWQKSNFYDWYWYVLHDSAYLASKGQSRKCHYMPSDVVTNDVAQLMEYARTNPLKQSQLELIRNMLLAGYDVYTIAQNLNIKAQNLAYFLEGVSVLASMTTNRNGRPNHEPKQLDAGENEDD